MIENWYTQRGIYFNTERQLWTFLVKEMSI